MAEVDFERRLERMFNDAPMFADGEAFAARVETRLDRGWGARRALIWCAGVAGGVIGASQLLVSNLRPGLDSMNFGPSENWTQWRETAHVLDWLPAIAGGETLWLIAALAAAAIGLGLTSALEEI